MVNNMQIDEANDEDLITPRPYQDLMKNICVRQNTIIYLPTGAGKTFIAIMAMRHFAKALEKPLSEGGKRTVFVVNTVALARQQSEVLRKALPFQVGLYSGEMNVDAWKRDRWREEFEKNQIIVSTCQIIVDCVNHGYLSVVDLNVLVFDECHSGTGDHPMHQLMSKFENIPKHMQPRVIGLTGILLNNPTPQTVEDELAKLETVFQGTISTVDNFEEFNKVMQYSTDPQEICVSYDPLTITDKMVQIKQKIVEMVEIVGKFQTVQYRTTKMRNLKQDVPNKVKDVKRLLNDYNYQMEDFGLYGASIAILAVIVELELARLACESEPEAKLFKSAITVAEMVRHTLTNIMDCQESEYNKAMIFGSPKLKTLIQYLEEYVKQSEDIAKDMKALIFVQRRHTAKVLYHILKAVFLEKFDDDPEPQIRSDFMVGRACGAMPESIEQILADKNQRKVLDRFRKDETNLIVASSVLEEGIDIQSCNLVIRWDLPQQFRAYVQAKGRARMKNSKYVTMVCSNDKSYMTKLRTYKDIEVILKAALVGKTINRKPPLDKDISEELYDQLIPPFRTKNGAILTAVSSLGLLNRYSMIMPHDRFTNTSVYWERVDDHLNRKMAVNLYLPIQSTIKEPIQSNFFENIKLAKRHAGFLACKQLYLNGELSENLLPIDGTKKMIDVKEKYFKHWDDWENDNPKLAGTKQNKRAHDLMYPAKFLDCTPKIGLPCYLYVFNIQPLFDSTFTFNGIEDTTREIFHQLIGNGNSWAILTTKLLPEKLPPLKLFLSQGEVRVSMTCFPQGKMLTDENQLEKLKRFHIMTFADILNLKKEFYVFDHNGGNNSYFVVPTKSNQIDWDIINRFQGLTNMVEPTVFQMNKMTFKPADYLHKVIQPWYKMDQTKYIVTAVHTDKTPFSPFPESDFENFADYFAQKYGKKIIHHGQFMLEAKGITSHFNLLHPGTAKDGASAKITARQLRTEMYVPELCHNFAFPGDLWVKAVMLPGILHRVHYMILAENMRVNLNKRLGLHDSNEALIIDVDKKLNLDPKKVSKEAMQIDDDDSDDEIVTEDANKQVISPLTFPNVETMPSKEASKDITSFVDNLEPWNFKEEPVDYDRMWDEVYQVDLDYYINFITTRFEQHTIEEYVGSIGGSVHTLATNGATNGTTSKPQEILAIKDISFEERLKIDILDLTPTAPQLRDVLKAITTTSAMDVFDMERFEVLGDAFLKFATSLYLVHRHDTWHEGYLTECKGRIVSNRNLFYLATRMRLPGVIKLFKFDPKVDEWVPPLFKVPTKIKDFLNELNCSALELYKLNLTPEEFEQGYPQITTELRFVSEMQRRRNTGTVDKGCRAVIEQQFVGDKTVADCMEAVIGTYISAAGIKPGLKLLSILGILPDDEILPNVLTIQMKSGMMKQHAEPALVDEYLLNYRVLESNLGYSFKDRSYLLQALTHASFPTNSITGCYQELEFIGDAILDFLISSYIFQRCENMDPGQLTDLRSALVNNNTLACITVRNNFHLFLLSQNPVLQETINKFVDYQKVHNHVVTDQVQLLVTENDQFLADFIDVPKVLGDIFESLIGAIFFDSGNDLHVTWKIIYSLMHREVNEFIANTPKNLIRRLLEFPNAQPKFEIVPYEDCVKANLRFSCKNEVLAVNGFGQNKDDAKRAAAKAALVRLEQAK